jgi:hypothetical protein
VLRIHDNAEQRRWVRNRQRDKPFDHANAGRHPSRGLRERRSHQGKRSPTASAADDEELAQFDAKSRSGWLAFAGLLIVGFLGRNSRKLRALSYMLVLAFAGLCLSACGGVATNTNTNTVPNPPKGTYTITLIGTDSVTSSVTSQSTFTLVIN